MQIYYLHEILAHPFQTGESAERDDFYYNCSTSTTGTTVVSVDLDLQIYL